MKMRGEVDILVVVGIVMLVLGIAIGLATTVKAETEKECYEQADSKDFTAQVTILQYKISRAKRCRTFRCFYSHAPKNLGILTVYRHRNAKPKTTWGTLGWSKSVAVVRHPSQIRNALLLSAGVELPRLYGHAEKGFTVDELIAGDLKEHDAFVWEVKCLRRAGEKLVSFREIVEVP